jgi:PAS domain S-box-containing protein
MESKDKIKESNQEKYEGLGQVIEFKELKAKYARLEEELQNYREHVGEEVKKRTAQLVEINRHLQQKIIRHRRIEKILVRQRNLLQTLIDSLPDYLYVKNVKSQFVLVNRALMQFLGIATPDQIIGKTDFDFFPKELATRYYLDEQQIFRSGRLLVHQEEPMIDRTGNPGWFLTTKIPLRDNQGRIFGLVGLNRDITERKQSEEKLRRQNEYLAALNETTLALMNRLEIDDLLKTIIARAGNLLGTSHGFIFLVDSESKGTGSSPAPGMVLRVGVGVYSKYLGICLKPYEGLVGKVWQTGQTMVVEDYQTWPGRLPIFKEDVFHAIVAAPLKSGPNVVGVIGLGRLEVGQIFREDEIELLNRFAQLASIALDNAQLDTSAQQELAERKRTEKELYKAKEAAEIASRAKSTFLTHMSHEIRTPLNAILGYTQILQRDPHLTRSQRKAVNTIQKSGDHLLKLINDVLDLSKIEAGRMQLNPTDFDLVDLIADLSAMFQLRCEQNRLTWRVEGLEGRPHLLVRGDEGKLRQILINLLDNAVKFTSSGSVLLRVTQKDASRYLFEVIDTGPGIPVNIQKTIFDPFYQDEKGIRKGGTGLGLRISKTYVELMGGELAIESQEDQGARFFFTIPLSPILKESFLREDRKGKVSRLAPGYRVKALVVDDDPSNREVVADMLSEIGVEVLEAMNGQEAIEKVRKQTPDIVFIDYLMPVPDGVETIQRITEEFGKEKIKMVMMTALAFSHEQDRFLQAGCHRVITKPIRMEEIFDCLANLLKIEYEFEEIKSEDCLDSKNTTTLPALSKLHLPEDLLRRLKEGAEFCKITQLKQSLAEMEALGPEEAQLASYLREFINRYNLDGLQEIVGRLPF